MQKKREKKKKTISRGRKEGRLRGADNFGGKKAADDLSLKR